LSDYLKIPEVARRLDVSEKTARRYIRSAELPSAFIGGAYRVSEEDLDAYVRAAAVTPEEATTHPKARAPLPRDGGAGDRSLRAWRAFLWTLAGDWRETPPQSSREIKPLLSVINSLVNEGIFEDANADTAARGELSLLRLALAKLAEIADGVESDEVAAELRASLKLIPRDRDVA
jgi:excisionase family DNA binding protein